MFNLVITEKNQLEKELFEKLTQLNKNKYKIVDVLSINDANNCIVFCDIKRILSNSSQQIFQDFNNFYSNLKIIITKLAFDKKIVIIFNANLNESFHKNLVDLLLMLIFKEFNIESNFLNVASIDLKFIETSNYAKYYFDYNEFFDAETIEHIKELNIFFNDLDDAKINAKLSRYTIL